MTTHKHQCGLTAVGFLDVGCGHVFEHVGAGGDDPQERVEAHKCPICGLGPWYLPYRRGSVVDSLGLRIDAELENMVQGIREAVRNGDRH